MYKISVLRPVETTETIEAARNRAEWISRHKDSVAVVEDEHGPVLAIHNGIVAMRREGVPVDSILPGMRFQFGDSTYVRLGGGDSDKSVHAYEEGSHRYCFFAKAAKDLVQPLPTP